MSNLNLNEEEKIRFKVMIEDLEKIFCYDEILAKDIPNLVSELESEEVIDYIVHLSNGSKPESALREAFFAGRSLISKFLGGTSTPEVNLGKGFIDYILRVDGRFILIELKSLYEPIYESGKKRRVKLLKKREMKFERHKEQVLKYLREGSEYIILTDLKDWYFFNRKANPKSFTFFSHYEIQTLVEEYQVVGDFWDFLRRQDEQSIKEDLDKEFFESLTIWVEKLREIEFEADEQRKTQHIIRLLNKFIFIQTLDDLYVIDAKWIKTNWDEMERKWITKGKLKVLEQYFREINEWFYDYYDTELFRDDVLNVIKKDEANIEKFYDILQTVLGVTGWQTTFRGIAGIMQHNFRFIDEDIFGKAYETFLADVRHDEGIYYTPKYITEYIVDTTVGKTFDKILSEIKQALEKNDFESAQKGIKRFTSIRILDPACGSGSFLIKAVRIIMERYRVLKKLLDTLLSESNKYSGSLVRPKAVEEKTQKIQSLIIDLHSTNERELISRLLVRHIHGNDLDRKALEVAKVNIWLEAIKLAPQEFRYDRLPRDTNYILPDLEMNLVNGNSVVGLPDDQVIDFIVLNHRKELSELNILRNKYIENPTQPEQVIEIIKIKDKIREGLNVKFKDYILENQIPEEIIEDTMPFYWPLELWFLYFDEKGALEKHEIGPDIIIGNPPYERIQVLKKKSPAMVDFLNNVNFQSATGNYDLAVIFIEQALKLLRKEGKFGYIVTNKFIKADYGAGIRNYLSNFTSIEKIIDFGNQQVFDKATTYTTLLFLGNNLDEVFKYAFVKKLEKNRDQLDRIDANDELDTSKEKVFNVYHKELSQAPWIFSSPDEKLIYHKINQYDKLEKYYDRMFQGLVTGKDDVFILEPKEYMGNLIKVHSRSLNKEYILESQLIKPFLYGRNLKKWIVPKNDYVILFPYSINNNKATLIDEVTFSNAYPKCWDYLTANKNILENRERGKWKGVKNWYALGRRQNLEQFDQSKIMTQVLAYRSTFSIDAKRSYYFAGAGGSNGYGITLKNNLSLDYFCGLLNSSLLDWNLKKISTSHKGGYWIYAKRFLEKLCIKIPTTSEENKYHSIIEKTVNKILNIKTNRNEQFIKWNDVSTRISNSVRTLFDILKRDEDYQREGDFDSSWTIRASFYPSSKDELLKETFDNFSIIYVTEHTMINIYGVTNEGEEKMLYEVIFKNNELLSHIYNCLDKTLNSRLRIKTLKELLEKTNIPVIQPNLAENTINIMKKIKDESGEEEHTIGEIDNMIIEYEAQIDASVFKLYGLNSRDIHTVMGSLNLPPSYEQLVIKHFS